MKEESSWELKIKEQLNCPMPECYQWLLTERKKAVEKAFDLLEQYIPGIRNHVFEEDFQTKIREFVLRCKEQVEQWQYGIGGATIHRGFYCPSLVRDVVVGNCGRGRKQVQITAKTQNKITYEYGFFENRLIYVKKLSSGGERFSEYECILYDKDTQYSYLFDSSMILLGMSKCTFENGFMTDYSVFFWAYKKYYFYESEREEYEYFGEKLHSVTSWDVGLRDNSCTHTKYIFNHDEKGYLSSYRVINYRDGIEELDNVNRDRIYKVYERRKA